MSNKRETLTVKMNWGAMIAPPQKWRNVDFECLYWIETCHRWSLMVAVWPPIMLPCMWNCASLNVGVVWRYTMWFKSRSLNWTYLWLRHNCSWKWVLFRSEWFESNDSASNGSATSKQFDRPPIIIDKLTRADMIITVNLPSSMYSPSINRGQHLVYFVTVELLSK